MKNMIILLVLIVLALSKDVIDYQYEVDEIIERALNSNHHPFNTLAYLVDTFGPRPAGSQSYFQTAEWLIDEMKKNGLENVHKEKVENVMHVMKGNDELEITDPITRKLSVNAIAPGSSGEVVSDLIVLESMTDLTRTDVTDKIVLFNSKWSDYKEYAHCRMNCPLDASRHGASGVLISTMENEFGFYQNVWGVQNFWGDEDNARSLKKLVPIPAGIIPYQDANLIERVVKRSGEEKVIIRLRIETTFEIVDSYNVVGEIVGHEKPEEIVLIGGHLDSWDVGEGAVDDGDGVVVTYEALRILISLGWKPKRTIRVVAFCDEEVGVYHDGGMAYEEDESNVANIVKETHIFAMESDQGVFDLRGYKVGGLSGQTQSDQGGMVLMDELLYLQRSLFDEFCDEKEENQQQETGYWDDDDEICYRLEPITDGDMDEDVKAVITKNHVPWVIPISEFSEKYYELYHHTKSDRIEALDPDEMDKTVASIASLIFVVADMDNEFEVDQSQFL